MILKKQLLGDILLERKVITSIELQKALEVQQTKGGFLGDILVKLGFVEELDIVAALMIQCNLAYIAISQYEVNRKVIDLIPRKMAYDYQVVPLDRVGDILSVVMLDPLDASARAEIRRITHCEIAPFVTTKIEMVKALEKCYGSC